MRFDPCTGHACKPKLTGVYVGVLFHVRLLVEAFAAVLARVRSRVGVNQQVRGQRRRSLETLAALQTRERATSRSRRVSISTSASGCPLVPPSCRRHYVTRMHLPEVVVKRACRPVMFHAGVLRTANNPHTCNVNNNL